jgi:lysophospholipase L1-like esterase
MRVLIIGDSHCRELDVALIHNRRSIHTYSVYAPRKIPNIVLRYQSELANIIHFAPTALILHLGHNDIAYHHHLNGNPTHPRTVAQNVVQFAQLVANNHPGIQIFISTVYPRTCTPTSYFGPHDTISFNKKMKRYGQHLRTLTNAAGFTIFLNNIMWRRISRSLEEASHFSDDGLHLSIEAKIIVTREWLAQIDNM